MEEKDLDNEDIKEIRLQSKNYIEANLLWNLISIYKGASNDKFLDFFKNMDFRDEHNNKRIVESIHVINNNGFMTFGIWFKNESEISLYPFYYARVSNWFKNYIDSNIIKIEWK